METFAQVLARLRSADGLSYAQLARLAYCSDTYLWQIETQGRLPQRRLVAAIDTALRADGELLAALPPELGAVTAPLTVTDLPDLRATITHLTGLDGMHGADGLHRRAAELSTQYRRRLGRCVDRDVQTAVAELEQVAAWLAYDAGHVTRSRRLLESALTLAVGSPVERLCWDQLSNEAYDEGRPAEALAYAERGLALTPRGAVRGMFQLRRARALGLLGDEPEALAAMDQARSLIEAGPTGGETPQPWWVTWEDFLVHQGGLLLDLGHPREAVRVRTAALERVAALQPREQGLCRGYLALALVAAGDRRGALDLLGGVTPASTRVRHVFARVRTACR